MSLAIFDLDNTLIRGQSQWLLAGYLLKNRGVNLFYFLKVFLWFAGYKLGLFKDPKKIMVYSFQLVKNKKVAEINEFLNDFYNKILKHKLIKQAVDILEKHKNRGDRIILLSNVVKPLAEIVGRDLGVDEVIATELERISGKYTGRIKGNIIYGEHKVDIIKERFSGDLNNSFAYADHYSDLPLLKLVSHPVVVNPSRKIKRYIRKNNCLSYVSFVN